MSGFSQAATDRDTQAQDRALVVSVAMQKGGVGKTTSVINLARAASIRGLRVLVVDFDPQGNSTVTLAEPEVAEDQVSIADALSDKDHEPLSSVIVPTIWPGVLLAPAVTDALSEADDEISRARFGREHRLADALKPVLGDYDLILIDNAPALGQLLINALTASDLVFVVAEADGYSADGLSHLRDTVAMTKRHYNPALEWSGVLINRWRNTDDERARLNEIREHFTDAEVWDADKVPLWVSIKTTLNSGLGLDIAREARLRNLAHTYRRIVARWIEDPEVTL